MSPHGHTASGTEETAAYDVVVVGSVNLDLVARTRRLPAPGETVSGTSFAEHAGGKGLNQAVAAARSGASVAFVGAVGGDEPGTRLRALMRAEGIDDGHVATRTDLPTGRAMISVDDDGENSIVIVAGANGDAFTGDIPNGRVVLAQLETTPELVRRAFEHARTIGATTVLNPAPADASARGLLDLCDVLVPNEHEVDLLGGRDELAQRVDHLVVTLGAAGADHVHAGRTTRIEAYPAEPVDTTGAGDAFCGALASRLANGDDMVDALRYAAAAGALATTVDGAVPSQPFGDDVRRLQGA